MRTPWRLVSSKDFEHGLRVRLFCLAVLDQLDAVHQAHAANVADDGVFFLQFEQFVVKIIADDAGICPQVVFLDDLDHRQADGHRDRIAAKCRERQAGKASATSGVAIVQPIGTPLPMPFAEVMMSGSTPQCSMPNHLSPVRPHAVWTSSEINRPP